MPISSPPPAFCAPAPILAPPSARTPLLARSARTGFLRPPVRRAAFSSSSPPSRARRGARGASMVFTGLVEEMGVVESLERVDGDAGGVNLTVAATTTRTGVALGDSISVNGTCLTVTQLSDTGFTFGLAPETLRRTNLGKLATGSRVNLERSMGADGRFGGHVVQGHVDCTGRITRVRVEDDAKWFTITVPAEYMRLLVEKGYVAVDGTSLTVCDVMDDECSFSFMMIAYTQQKVVTAGKQVGDEVNVELDITGKYIDRIMSARPSVVDAK